MVEKDTSMFDGFTLILGIFIGALVATILFLSASLMDSSGISVTDDQDDRGPVAERIAPVARVLLLGDPGLAAAAAPAPAPVQVRTPLSGPQVFNEACYLCHAPPGVPGAPVLGDAVAWAARVSQGIDVLQEHALNGFTGDAGFMPPKGGRLDFSDDEVRAAVQYMIEQVTD